MQLRKKKKSLETQGGPTCSGLRSVQVTQSIPDTV